MMDNAEVAISQCTHLNFEQAGACIQCIKHAIAQAVKPWQEARWAQVDAMNRLGVLGSPVEELTRMTGEIARLWAEVTK